MCYRDGAEHRANEKQNSHVENNGNASALSTEIYNGYLLYGWALNISWDGNRWDSEGNHCTMDYLPQQPLH